MIVDTIQYNKLTFHRDSSGARSEPMDFKGLELGQTLGLERSSDRLNGLSTEQPPSVSTSENDFSSPMDGDVMLGNIPLSVPSTPYNFDGVDDDDEDEMDTMNSDELLHHTVHK
jgi:hypothetical protein